MQHSRRARALTALVLLASVLPAGPFIVDAKILRER